MGSIVSTQTNTEYARYFREIVTAGWANMSDGSVESPVGHFAAVSIEPAEVTELVEAVFEDQQPTIYPGEYLVREDSDGNTELTEWLSFDALMRVFKSLQCEFALWAPMCPNCDNEGPHTRLRGNTFQCACGHTFDPTEGLS